MKYLSCVLLLLFSSIACGQTDLLSKEGSRYYYKNQEFKCKDLGVVYADYQEALNIYTAGRNNVRAANVTAYFGIGFVALGIVGALSNDSVEGLVSGGLAISIGLLLELIAIVPRVIGKRKLRKALRIFNFEMIERHGYGYDSSLSFGVTRNGVGIVLQF